MTSPKWPHTAAVLFGGKSSRMGQPKAAIIYNNKTLLSHVVDTAAAVCRQVVVVGDAGEAKSAGVNNRCLPDLTGGLGPVGGLQAVLQSGIDEDYLVLAADLFRLLPGTLALLLSPGVASPAALSWQGRLEPLLARYPASVSATVDDQIRAGELSLQSLLKRICPQVIHVPPELKLTLANANTPEDLRS